MIGESSVASSITASRENRTRRISRCTMCRGSGHNRSTCREIYRGDIRNEVVRSNICSRCGLEGHSITDCPQFLADRAMYVTNTCSWCGLEGHHMSRCVRFLGPGSNADVRVAADVRVVEEKKKTKSYLKELVVVCAEEEVDDGRVECGICFEEFCKGVTVLTNCKHAYCYSCIEGYAESIKDKTCKPTCALCRGDLCELTVFNEVMKKITMKLIKEL